MACKPCEHTSPPKTTIPLPVPVYVEQRPCPACGGPMESTTKLDRDTGLEFKIWFCLNRVCDYRERVQ